MAEDDPIPGNPDEFQIVADPLSFPDDFVVDDNHPAGRLFGIDMPGQFDSRDTFL
jgi:hypothetical protein